MSIPIALFAYNRPAHLKLCLEFLENSQQKLEKRLPLYIFCDAAASKEQQVMVDETRKVAHAWVAQYGGAVIERTKNRRFENITSGITALIEKYGKAIIVEDDVVVAPDFLSYMVEALYKYQDDPQVFMISGFMYFNSQKPRTSRPSTFFLNTAFIWGWATWGRAWKHYTWEPTGIPEFLADKKQKYLFDIYGSFPFSKILEKQWKKECNTWDIQWMYILFQQGALSLYPHQSLVWNSGVGGGTHGAAKELDKDPLQCKKEEYIHGNMALDDFRKPRLKNLQFPQETKVDKKALQRLAKVFLKQRGKSSHFFWFRRIVDLFRN